ncbi:MAG: saccharopine dehydrogenase C-terminal domain-containing protein [Candidatus Thermoplasmatota archaeon]|nr:saccharopine dehydrogenase C-terminal domain-containing protein [Candidatus Thermoplasmatota archaeon]
MYDFIALGCGLVGKFVVTKLTDMGYKVHVVDLKIPDEIKHNISISYIEGDVFHIVEDLPETKMILNLLPGSIGEIVRPTLISKGIDIIDLAFTESEPTIHNQLAVNNDCKLIWDVGIAPGFSNMLIKKEYTNDNKINEVTIKVGGNPAQPDGEWSYMAPFSPSDVIEEYTRPARIIENRKLKIVDALTDLHPINVKNYGMMEAFLTDGLRSLLDSKMATNMREYTVRWPGHIQKWLATKDTISDDELIESWKFDQTVDEFTWMEIRITYDDYQVAWEVLDSGKDGASSMARTTGLVTLACAVELLTSHGSDLSVIQPGVLAPEDLPIDSIERVIEVMISEGVTITRTIIE